MHQAMHANPGVLLLQPPRLFSGGREKTKLYTPIPIRWFWTTFQVLVAGRRKNKQTPPAQQEWIPQTSLMTEFSFTVFALPTCLATGSDKFARPPGEEATSDAKCFLRLDCCICAS